MSVCKACGKPVTSDEIGLTKKLINRGCVQFYCIPCLAKQFRCSEDLLKNKIEQFRAQGCSLF